MIDNKYHEAYNRLTCGIFKIQPTNKKIIKLIKVSKLNTDNLIISIFLLYKLKLNSIITIDDKLIDKIIIVSLILSNKLLQDSNYSFKTWIKLFQIVKININLKLLNQLEVLVLTGLDYHLDFKFIQYNHQFWNHLKTINFYHYKLFNDYINHRPVDSPITPVDSPLLQQQDKYDYEYGQRLPFNAGLMKQDQLPLVPLDAIPQVYSTMSQPPSSNAFLLSSTVPVASVTPAPMPMPSMNYEYNEQIMTSIPVALTFCNNYV